MEYLLENIKKGLKFELIDDSIAGFQGRYVGSFLENRDNCFVISIPKMNEREYVFKRGEKINIHVYTDEGIYSIESDVIDFGDDYCVISMPTVLKHSQRREFLRANLELKVLLSFRNENYELEHHEIKTINVCGRGICFNFKENISKIKDAHVEIFLSEQIVETDAEIVYVRPSNTEEGLMFFVAMMLTTISNQDTNAIVRECFLYKLKENVDERSNHHK